MVSGVLLFTQSHHSQVYKASHIFFWSSKIKSKKFAAKFLVYYFSKKPVLQNVLRREIVFILLCVGRMSICFTEIGIGRNNTGIRIFKRHNHIINLHTLYLLYILFDFNGVNVILCWCYSGLKVVFDFLYYCN